MKFHLWVYIITVLFVDSPCLLTSAETYPEGSGDSDLTKEASSPYIQEDGNLVRKVRVSGNGVNYECVLLTMEDSGLLSTGNYNLIGNVIFNEEYGKLIVFSGQNCFLKDFTKGFPTSVQMSAQNCQEVQTEMRQMNGHSNYIRGVISEENSMSTNPLKAYYPNYQRASYPADTLSNYYTPVLQPRIINSFGGYSIWESDPYTSSNGQRVRIIKIKVPGTSPGESFEVPSTEDIGTLSMKENKFYIGERFYSDTPDTLVVLSEEKRCLLRKYSGSSPPVTEDITDSKKCKQIHKKMKKKNGRKVLGTAVAISDNQVTQQSSQKPQNPLSRMAKRITTGIGQLARTIGNKFARFFKRNGQEKS